MDVANNFVGEKANRKRLFGKLSTKDVPKKGVVFDEIDTNCGIVNRVSMCVHECVFWKGGRLWLGQCARIIYFSLGAGLIPQAKLGIVSSRSCSIRGQVTVRKRRVAKKWKRTGEKGIWNYLTRDWFARKSWIRWVIYSLVVYPNIMQGSILPVTIPPGHTPGDLQFFSYLAVYSPPPGTQKETIPHPRDSSSTTNTLFCVQNWFPYNSTTRRF